MRLLLVEDDRALADELLARIRALLRRAHGRAAAEIASDAFTLDEDHQCVLLVGEICEPMEIANLQFDNHRSTNLR